MNIISSVGLFNKKLIKLILCFQGGVAIVSVTPVAAAATPAAIPAAIPAAAPVAPNIEFYQAAEGVEEFSRNAPAAVELISGSESGSESESESDSDFVDEAPPIKKLKMQRQGCFFRR